MNKNELIELISREVREGRRRTWAEYGELIGEHKDRVRSWYRRRGSEEPDMVDLSKGTTYEYKEDGYKVDTYYDHPPTPDDVIRDHKIDTTKWKLNGFYSKAKSKGWHVTALFHPVVQKEHSIRLSDIEKAVKKYMTAKPVKPRIKPVKSDYVLRIMITDIHIGMDVSDKGKSLYGGKWDRDELLRRGDIVIQEIIEEIQRYNPKEIVISDLGDFMDGYEGTTTRKSHSLPQNLSDVECFNLGIEFKMRIIDSIYDACDIPIRFYNTVDDNHGGKFGHMVNTAIQKIVEAKYHRDDVDYVIFDKFMGHYNIGDFFFIQTHGKDAEKMNKPFPVHIDKQTNDKIYEYLKHHKLYGRGYKIEVSKGDSHQCLFDDTNVDFDYYSYPAFAPSSGWVQVNFSKGKSGFVKQIIDLARQRKTTTPVYFEWHD